MKIVVAMMVLGGAIASPSATRADEPSVAECLAASSASIRLDNEHRLRAERTELLRCASAVCPSEIRNECIRRVDEVTSAIPTLILGAEDGNGNDLSSVKVTMDGEVLTDRLQGIAITIDPGVHTFIFESAGLAPLRRSWVIRQGQKNRTEIVTLTADGAPAAGRAGRAPASDRALQAPMVRSSREAGVALGTQEKWAIGVATLGAVGLGIGTAFGLQARIKRNDARAVCPGVCASQEGVDRWHDAKLAGNVSTAAFIAGGVGVAAAAILWLTASPSTANERAQLQASELVELRVLGPAPGGDGRVSLAIGGRF